VAFSPEACLELCDFVAVGANDLMQYFFAADRQNPRVSDRYDVLAPAPLKMLRSIVTACDAAGKPVSVCGEMAGRPLEACVLAALGYRGLSMAASSIGPVKRALARCDTGMLRAWLDAEIDRIPSPDEPSLRNKLLKVAERAGLPPEAVENRARV
jgi:phosphotransferase system, enzyme I, PtsP